MYAVTDGKQRPDEDDGNLPPLDSDGMDDTPDDDELGIAEEFADEEDIDGSDLSVGLLLEEDVLPEGDDAESDDLSETEDAGDLIGDAMNVPELGDDADGYGDEGDEGLDVGESDGLEELPPLHHDDEDGVEGWAAERADLPELPALSALEDGGEEGLLADDEPGPPSTPDGAQGISVEVAPGVRWGQVPFVEVHDIARPVSDLSDPVCAAVAGTVLVHLDRMYALREGNLEAFGGEGLLGRPVILCSAASDSLHVWAVGTGRVQYSGDAGLAFAAPIAIGEGEPIRAAMLADGRLLAACAGTLYECEPEGRAACVLPIEGEVIDVAADGQTAAVALRDGRVLLAEQPAEGFRPFVLGSHEPQAMQLRGRALLMSTPEALLLYEGSSCREVSFAVGHAYQLGFEPGGVALYGFVWVKQEWLLVKVPVSGVSRRPAVLARAKARHGVPRSLCLLRHGEQVVLFVAFESGFLEVQVSGEQD